MQFQTTEHCSKLGEACAGFWDVRKKPMCTHFKVYIVPPSFCCIRICVLCTWSNIAIEKKKSWVPKKKKKAMLLAWAKWCTTVWFLQEGFSLDGTHVYPVQNVDFFGSTWAGSSNAKACGLCLQLFSSLEPFSWALHYVLCTFNLYKCCENAQVSCYREKEAASSVHKFLFCSQACNLPATKNLQHMFKGMLRSIVILSNQFVRSNLQR